jgi:hypothetical protein
MYLHVLKSGFVCAFYELFRRSNRGWNDNRLDNCLRTLYEEFPRLLETAHGTQCPSVNLLEVNFADFQFFIGRTWRDFFASVSILQKR